VRFTEHAKLRMIERGIRIEWVERTVERPEFVRPSMSRPARKSAFRRIEELGNRWLHVTFDAEMGGIVVVSAYVDHKAERKR
jgi:hypothetical protein